LSRSSDIVELAEADLRLVMPVSAIKVGARHRRDMGDLDRLARSIKEVGLLHPIVVDPRGNLIAGERRLRSRSEILGSSEIPVRIVDLEEIVRGELAENAERKDLLPSEIDAIRRSLEPLERAAARARMSDGGKGANVSQPSRATDRIGAFAGVSGRSVEMIAAVVEAAERDPQRFGPLVEEMDRVRHIAGPYRKLNRALDGDRVGSLAVRPGRYRTLVLDPPWPWDMGGSRDLDYASMSLEAIAALPVPAWAEDYAHCYLWSTNAHLTHACVFMARWGFVQKTVLTWRKPHGGLGYFFRNRTEHCLFGVRGHLETKPAAAGIWTDFEAAPGPHSLKPEGFYEIVRAASHEPFGEAFQRTGRPDFLRPFCRSGGGVMTAKSRGAP
jgi:N6-adenosine-specific RNA methylase IME4